MTYTIETTPLPALAGLGGMNIPTIVRPLTSADLSQLDASRIVYGLASPVMQMFGILTLNHRSLTDFAAELCSPSTKFSDPQMLMNRHILNYLASANALLGHFGVTFKQRCREVGNPVDGFDRFCRQLKEDSDVFEFFCEFRNHALHVGLPVGNIEIKDSISAGRTVSIIHKTKDLLKHGSRDLKRCRLLASVSEIDLLSQLEAFHTVFMAHVFPFIVDCLKPGLVQSSRFHAKLTTEVKTIGSNLRAVIMTNRTQVGDEFKWSFELIPEDLLNDLGIVIMVKTQNDSPTTACTGPLTSAQRV